MTTAESPIVIDNREKKPYNFPTVDSVIHKEIETGDYTRQGFEDTFAVERKTLDDLATSLGAERDRFEREIERAQMLDEFVVVVEAEADAVYEFADQSDCPNYYSSIHPNSIIGTVEQWPDKYDTLTFEWCGDRNGAMQETLYYLDKWYMDHR